MSMTTGYSPTIGNLKEVHQELILSARYHAADITFRNKVDGLMKRIEDNMPLLFEREKTTDLRGLQNEFPLLDKGIDLFFELEQLLSKTY